MKTLHVTSLVALLSFIWATPVLADLVRTFDSYHAFFVYADDGVNTNLFRNDAQAMQNFFDNFPTPWATNLYGVNEGAGSMSLLDAMNDMKDPNVAKPDELLFFYYSGHGGGTCINPFGPLKCVPPQMQPGTGVADANMDESNIEDPPPVPGYAMDMTDETLAFGQNAGDFVLDDVFGDLIDMIQMQGAFVSGAMDACHSNGMLDGSRDIRGFMGRMSVWMTSATEWEVAPLACGSGFGTIVDRLTRVAPGDVDQIGDLQSWFLNGAAFGGFESTIGVKMYNDLDGDKLYFQMIPEPSTLVLLGTGFAALVGLGWRKQRSRENQG